MHCSIARLVWRLATGWTAEVSEFESRWGQGFSLFHFIQTDCGAHPASYSMGTGDFFFNLYSGGEVQLGPLGTAATIRPIVPAPADYDDGEIGGMIGMGNRSTRRKPAPVPLCPPQTPHAARTRTRAAAVGSQRLTA
jgi:hypothetical protein